MKFRIINGKIALLLLASYHFEEFPDHATFPDGCLTCKFMADYEKEHLFPK